MARRVGDRVTCADIAARDRVLTDHQRKELVRWLESECFTLYEGMTGPVSVNDARAILSFWGLGDGDTRYLGGVFPRSRWRGVGYVMSDSGRCHARMIRTFAPRTGVVVAPVDRPAWLDEAW